MHHVHRRLLGTLVAFVLTAGLLSGCSLRPGQRPGSATVRADLPEPQASGTVDRTRLSKELNVFNWTEYLPESVLKDFERLYGVKVNYDTYSSNEELHAKLTAGATGYDVVFPSDYMMQVLLRGRLLHKLDHQNIPNLTNLEARFRNLPFDPQNEFSVPYMWGTTGIAVNTEKVDPNQVKRWADLWRPEFKGKLVLPDDARETLGIALRAGGNSINATDPAALKQALEKLHTLKPNIRAFNSDSPKDLLLSGEVWLGVVWSGEAAKAMQENPSIHYVLPEEGSTIWMDSLAIPKGAPHQYTAEVFINFLLDPSVSARLSLSYPYGNPNEKAQQLLPAEHRENPAIHPPEETLRKAEWLKDLGDEANQLYDRAWTEFKSR